MISGDDVDVGAHLEVSYLSQVEYSTYWKIRSLELIQVLCRVFDKDGSNTLFAILKVQEIVDFGVVFINVH